MNKGKNPRKQRQLKQNSKQFLYDQYLLSFSETVEISRPAQGLFACVKPKYPASQFLPEVGSARQRNPPANRPLHKHPGSAFRFVIDTVIPNTLTIAPGLVFSFV
jgi:hypothetical protein